MTLDPFTIVFEVANFLVLVLLLRRYLFRPVQQIIARRRQEIADREAEVSTREEAAAKLRVDYESRLARVDEEAEQIRRDASRRADAEASRLLDEARARALGTREHLEAEISATREKLLAELTKEVAAVAVEGARRILADVGAQSLVEAYARSGAQRLRTLRGDRVNEGPVRVWVPPDAEVESLRNTLVGVLGPAVRLEIRTDPMLVGGVRLLQGELEVDANAGAVLADWLGAVSESPPASSIPVLGHPA